MTRKEVRGILIKSLTSNILNFKILFLLLIFMLATTSAFMVVVQKYHYKKLLDKEHSCYKRKQELLNQWTQISLEYNTLASPYNIEEFAKKRNMYFPSTKEIKIIK